MKLETTRIAVRLTGVSDIMFDRFIDYSTEKRPPEQKLYLYGENEIVLPRENIEAFLFGQDPKGCALTFEGKRGKDYARMGMSHVFIDEAVIPFLDGKGKPVIFSGFTGGSLWLHHGSGRTKKGSLSIKGEAKDRPVLKMPWSLDFTFSIIKNNLIDETKLFNWLTVGGMQVALGTYRPRWGRFVVEKFEETK